MAPCRKRITAILVFVFFLPIFPPNVLAAYLYSWPSTPSITDTDPPGAPANAGQDITNAWQAFDGTYHYFRIDVAAAPSATFPPGFAPVYGVYIDSKAGGAPSNDENIPGELTGIDFILSTQFTLDKKETSVLVWDSVLQVWKDTDFHGNGGSIPEFQWDGATLEWKVADNYQGRGSRKKDIGYPYTWWAATLEPGTSVVTFDITGPVVAPIPNAAWLFGSGIIGLIGLRRKVNKGNDKWRA